MIISDINFVYDLSDAESSVAVQGGESYAALYIKEPGKHPEKYEYGEKPPEKYQIGDILSDNVVTQIAIANSLAVGALSATAISIASNELLGD